PGLELAQRPIHDFLELRALGAEDQAQHVAEQVLLHQDRVKAVHRYPEQRRIVVTATQDIDRLLDDVQALPPVLAPTIADDGTRIQILAAGSGLPSRPDLCRAAGLPGDERSVVGGSAASGRS